MNKREWNRRDFIVRSLVWAGGRKHVGWNQSVGRIH
jgi:hypothetical protein